MIKKIILIVILLTRPIFAAPIVNNVSGTVADGQSVVISTTDAGPTGPNIIVYDNFEGIPGDAVSLSAPVGTWEAHGIYVPRYTSAYAHSGNTSDLACSNEVGNRLRAVYAPTDKIYVSYWTYLPSDKYFPGSSELLTIAGVSAWKMVWFVNDGSTAVNDYINISSVSPWWITGGNNLSFGDSGRVARDPAAEPYESFFVFGEWFRVSTWVKPGDIPQTDVGFIKTETLSATKGMYQKQNDVVVFGSVNAQPPYTWNELWIPGWQINQDSPDAYDTTFYHDDVYIASGDGAAARVEIGDNSVYSQCTNLSVCTVTSWTDHTVIATLRAGSLSGLSYIFVIDEAGVASDGYAVTIGGEPTIDNPVVEILTESGQTTTAYIFTITGTATADTDQTISGVVCSGQTVTPDDGAWDEQEEAFTCLANLALGENTLVFIGSDGTRTGHDSVTVTRIRKTAKMNGSATIKNATIHQ